jgi:hypothetical protein
MVIDPIELELLQANAQMAFDQMRAYIAATDEVAAAMKARGLADVAEMLSHERMNRRIAQILAAKQ